MNVTSYLDWHPTLIDPTARREAKPRTSGQTMVIDKGLGLHAFEDLLQTAASHIDMIKIGFGTSPLYPQILLQKKIELAKAHHITVYPGGTFLEVAIARGVVDNYFETVKRLGFSGIEISDGTIEMRRGLRSQLILRGLDYGWTIFTEYGKKCWGSSIEIEDLIQTATTDIHLGANLVTIEGRESGVGVGIFDENGACKDEQIQLVLESIPGQHLLLWEAPQKSQQVHLIKMLGAEVNFGNISAEDVLSLEALRRGLRADTFCYEDL